MILLDKNVLSEALRPAPEARVLEWLDRHFESCATSAVTLFELDAGVRLLPAGRRRESLALAVERMVRRFDGRVFAFDAQAARSAAALMSVAPERGLGLHRIPAKLADLQIAGIAAAYGFTLATRNRGDFAGLGLEIVSPWEVSRPGASGA